MANYRKHNGLADDQAVTLNFDGEPLGPEELMQDTEISDMDCIDVHIG